MSLEQSVRKAKEEDHRGPKCSIYRLLSDTSPLTEEDKAFVVKVLSIPITALDRISFRSLAKSVKENYNMNIGHSTYTRHNRKECRCWDNPVQEMGK